MVQTCHCPLTLALDQAQQARRWALARGEVMACCMLPQLWQTAPSIAGHWGRQQTEEDSGGCMDSGCGQWEVEEGKRNCVCSWQDQIILGTLGRCVLHLPLHWTSFVVSPVPPGEWHSTASLGSFNHCLLSCWWSDKSDHVWRECRSTYLVSTEAT